ncbi:hypothetical protein HA142_06085 [Prochlorococcus marinus str. XMU1401]|uniref:Uncharacterized protein n=1 Tax=Prochlorococcus marinus str. XMU1401 TaxID=2052594 RepID=A0A8I1X3B8_PROMR|nr:hypothetical protein [Prochlorococcus marinus]MBO8223078.1 hypothetical protein [Prochlorococcus marinus str. XMU1401]MBW3059621.1 hypothetical protein [Prochlorococcus marinus str. XMU1401E]
MCAYSDPNNFETVPLQIIKLIEMCHYKGYDISKRKDLIKVQKKTNKIVKLICGLDRNEDVELAMERYSQEEEE